MIARRHRTVGTGNLVDIAIALKQVQGLLSQLQFASMLSERLLGLGLEVNVAITLGNGQTTV